MQAILGGRSEQWEGRGDFTAQVSANRAGLTRLRALIDELGVNDFSASLKALDDYGAQLARSALQTIPDGNYYYCDLMDDDGSGRVDIPICARVSVHDGNIAVDFDGTSAQVPGNINCPLSVAAAAVYYVFRCLMPDHTPACAGSFRSIRISALRGSLLNAERPAAVAAGNVETSTRIVDVLCGALAAALPTRIPAASHGSMNNLAMGERRGGHDWDYYETLGGGMGASSIHDGQSAVQTHMTNTLNTPIEALEMRFPLRIRRYQVRTGSGGAGQHRGGDGLIREFEFLAPTEVTLIGERRRHPPWGLAGGQAGKSAINHLDGQELPGKVSLRVQAGQRLTIETAGGGGWGPATNG
jgi:N-methylhydantoinase B